MPSIKQSINQINALEELAYKNTPLHRLNPLTKLILTFCYILVVISYRPYEISGLISFAGIPILCLIIGEIPIKPLIKRCILALPFAAFAGMSNILLNRNVAFLLWDIGVTEGFISCMSLIIKTLITVMMVLLLISTTTMNSMIYAMHRLRVPSIIVIQLMMTYRYMNVLLNEAGVMYQAYTLRSGKERGIKMKDMGSFLGQLILRSMDRAERIYHGMKCRGFEGGILFAPKEQYGSKDIIILMVALSLFLLMRVINVSEILGEFLITSFR